MNSITPTQADQLLCSMYRTVWPKTALSPTAASSSPPQRFVISVHDLYEVLKQYEYCFFFYPRGLSEALLRAVQTYVYPYGADRNSAILDDLDMYLDGLDDHNAIPWKVEDIVERIEGVVAEMDRGIYQHLNMHFGEAEFEVTEVTPLIPSLAFVVTVSFDPPAPYPVVRTSGL